MFTVSRLFQAEKEIEIAGKRLKVRALSDWENQERFRNALLERVKVDKALKDPNSTEYQVNIYPIESATDDELRESLSMYRKREIADRVYAEIKIDYIPFPDDATDEERSEVLQKREANETEVAEKQVSEMKKRSLLADEEIKTLERERLVADNIRYRKQYVGQTAFADAYVHQALLMAVESESGKAYFGGVDQVRKLPSEVMNELLETFSEVNNVDVLKLKLPSATE